MAMLNMDNEDGLDVSPMDGMPTSESCAQNKVMMCYFPQGETMQVWLQKWCVSTMECSDASSMSMSAPMDHEGKTPDDSEDADMDMEAVHCLDCDIACMDSMSDMLDMVIQRKMSGHEWNPAALEMVREIARDLKLALD